MERRPLFWLAVGGWCAVMATGCGGSGGDAAGEKASESSGLPTASIGGGGKKARPVEDESETPKEPEPGTPEWNLLEITKIRVQTTPAAENLDVAKLAQIRRERNERIIDLATAVIAATHQNPKQEELLVAGVHQLMESRTQLALQGNAEDVEALYSDCETLQKKFPKSKAAAEAAFSRVLFARTNATMRGLKEPRWLEEFARQARLFATTFPEEETRAMIVLQAAARSCELHQKTSEAAACYAEIERKFPKHQHAAQASAALRRLSLKGQTLQLAGPTLDGGFSRIDDFAGKLVLVCFWDTESEEFLKAVPMLQAMAKKYGKAGFAVIGVNLDEEESTVAEFLEEHPMPWPHIFHPDPLQRRWDNPVAKYYSVQDVPTLWLVDGEGTVVDLAVQPETMEKTVRDQLAKMPQASR
ncbi:MAG: TlpA family protein disulfide reductase [Planctomycetaceae bacterium]|nr:TlpA family protein disulfide reductase [Planctomycetaceae bacterium]